MAEQFEHLSFERETLTNPRRKGQAPFFHTRKDKAAHGNQMRAALDSARQKLVQQHASRPNAIVLKLHYVGTLSIDKLQSFGLDFIGQDGDKICIVFTTEAGIAKFSDHLQRLGLGEIITNGQLLEALNGIDQWSADDRRSWALSENGLPDATSFTLDLSLWPLGDLGSQTRADLIKSFEQWLTDNHINTKDKVNLDSLLMYRLTVDRDQADMLLNHVDVRMVDLPPRSGITVTQLSRDIAELPTDIPTPALTAPRVCILDSGINTNHPLLRSAIAESESFVQAESESDLAGHGTAVAGIALYGDVETCERANLWQPACWLYNGKILNSNCEYDELQIENTLRKAVTYFVELGCRIFNLSVGNVNAPYHGGHVQGMAYVLDTLAREFDVLFIVSVGNFLGLDDPQIPADSWRDEYPDYLLGDHNVLIDPAPALNAITVGSIATHEATQNNQRWPDEIEHHCAANTGQPSPFTRHGPGHKDSIKPDLVAAGGNYAVPLRREGEQWAPVTTSPGVMTLNHNSIGNTIFSVMNGTSFAAPYITHLASRLMAEYPGASTNSIRALLVSQAEITNACEKTFGNEFAKTYARENKKRKPITDVVGYGEVNEGNLYRSDQSVVLLMSEESICADETQFFEIPLPDDFLANTTSSREISVALSYFPAVRTTRVDYRATKIQYVLVRGKSLEEVQKHFNQKFKKDVDTLNDSIDDKRRTVSAQRRSRGTLQYSRFAFTRLPESEKWFVAATRLDSFGWGYECSKEKESYSIVVTVADRQSESQSNTNGCTQVKFNWNTSKTIRHSGAYLLAPTTTQRTYLRR